MVSGDSRSYNPAVVEEWKTDCQNYWELRPQGYLQFGENQISLWLPPNKTLTVKDDPCDGGK
jgi:hypothetical protein